MFGCVGGGLRFVGIFGDRRREEAAKGRQFFFQIDFGLDEPIPIHGHQHIDAGILVLDLAGAGTDQKSGGVADVVDVDALAGEGIERATSAEDRKSDRLAQFAEIGFHAEQLIEEYLLVGVLAGDAD